eukprot:scaffold8514_cov125-Isochrysis_galbana.AAC.6
MRQHDCGTPGSRRSVEWGSWSSASSVTRRKKWQPSSSSPRVEKSDTQKLLDVIEARCRAVLAQEPPGRR